MKARALASVAVACCVTRAAFGDPAGGLLSNAHRFPGLRPGEAVNVQEVTFGNPGWAPVKVVRGASRLPPGATTAKVEILSFGKAGAQKVIVARGAVATPEPRRSMRVETVSSTGPRPGSVTVFRGIAGQEFTADLFAPARDGDLERIAFAVDGIESRHGAGLPAHAIVTLNNNGGNSLTGLAASVPNFSHSYTTFDCLQH